jgi:hypothetical protein
MFSQTLTTAAPITGIVGDANQSSDNTFDEPVPITVEDWMIEQRRDPSFLKDLETIPDIACRDGLYLHAPDEQPPRIIVPPQTQEALIRFTHERMFHLGHAKVADRLSKSYFWPTCVGMFAESFRTVPRVSWRKLVKIKLTVCSALARMTHRDLDMRWTSKVRERRLPANKRRSALLIRRPVSSRSSHFRTVESKLSSNLSWTK